MEFITYRHSFNSGDLLTVLPGIKTQYKKTGKRAIISQRLNLVANYGHNDTHPVKDSSGASVCMNKSMFDMLKPLIDAQEYVERFEIWEGQEFEVDYDLTRHDARMPLPGGNIYYWPTLIYPQLAPDLSEPWLDVPLTSIGNRIIINRTERYLNPYIDYFFLKKYPSEMFAFAGTENEHKIFCNQWGVKITRLDATDFRILAMAIKSCRFFIGNQSFLFHAAQGLDVPRILELCTAYPNTFPSNTNGHAFVSQNSLELYFNKLLKETE